VFRELIPLRAVYRYTMPPMLFRTVTVVFACAVVSSAAAQPASREQLKAECDGLVAAAVKTRFGWGWGHMPERTPVEPPGAAQSGRRRAPVRPPEKLLPKGHYNVDMRDTAASGLVLHLAGRELGKKQYGDAALQAAKLVVAVQGAKGQVPAVGALRANAGGRDEPAAVPARGATVASLALLLTILHDDPDGSHESLRGAALKASHWLAAQQTRAGGFPVAFPPDAPPDKASRLIRLDVPDYRDATAALWLAAKVLESDKPEGDRKIRRRAEAAAGELLVMRSAEPGSAGKDLWTTAYDLDATPLRAVRLREQFPEVIDVAASRNAVQALLAACLTGDADATMPALREAQTALMKLPREGGKWRKQYDLEARAKSGAAGEGRPAEAEAEAELDPRDAEGPGSVFDMSEGDREDEYAAGVAELMLALSRLNEQGAEEYRETLSTQLPVEHRLALLVAGLWEEALTEQAPAGDASAVPEYLRLHKTRWPILDDGPPSDVTTRLRRLAALLWRARVESAKS